MFVQVKYIIFYEIHNILVFSFHQNWIIIIFIIIIFKKQKSFKHIIYL